MSKLFDHFCLGVNYWPRHRGINMWKDWHPEEIDQEFGEMESLGINTVRMFLVWEDFQPVKEWLGGRQATVIKTSFAHDEHATLDEHPSMVDPVMIERFEQMLDLAQKHNLKLMPAFLTGWMSGVDMVPPFAVRRNTYTDSHVLRYEVLYARHLAEHFKDHPAIIAWDLGNEQNNVDACPSMDAAWVWTNYLATTLKRYDPETPVTSGMHGLGMSRYGSHTGHKPWQIQDVAESCDFTTPHPYPGFYRDCVDDPLSIRPSLLATFLSRLYSGIGGKPAMCQEYGSLGQTYMSDDVAASFGRVTMHSCLVNEDLGAIWWRHTDFTCVQDLPHDGSQMESDGLGMFDETGKAKPVTREYKKMAGLLGKIDFPNFTAKRARAAIVVPFREGVPEDQSKIFMAFILSKQAGINADIIRPESDFSAYDLLIAPSLTTHAPLRVSDWLRLLARVKEGATLYVSYDNCALRNMGEAFGVKINNKTKPRHQARFLEFLEDFGSLKKGEKLELQGSANWTLDTESAEADVIARNPEGCPALTVHDYGKGKTVLCLEALERLLIGVPHVFEENQSYRIYEALKELAGIDGDVKMSHPFIERTLHSMGKARLLTLINHSPAPAEAHVELDVQAGRITELHSDRDIAFETANDRVTFPVELGPSEVLVYRLDPKD